MKSYSKGVGSLCERANCEKLRRATSRPQKLTPRKRQAMIFSKMHTNIRYSSNSHGLFESSIWSTTYCMESSSRRKFKVMCAAADVRKVTAGVVDTVDPSVSVVKKNIHNERNIPQERVRNFCIIAHIGECPKRIYS